MSKKMHYGLLLLTVASVCVAGIDGAYIAVKDKIDIARKERDLRSAACVLQLDDLSKLKERTFEYSNSTGAKQTIIYYEYEEKHLIAVKGSAQGFGGKVEAIVGWTEDLNNVVGISVSAPKETPGFGDRVNEVLSENTWYNLLTGTMKDETGKCPWFQEQFSGNTIAQAKLKKDGGQIDAITGATITSNAVVRAVRASDELARKILKK
jgi:RnfABCDGE-type electron transport complex G subunit